MVFLWIGENVGFYPAAGVTVAATLITRIPFRLALGVS